MHSSAECNTPHIIHTPATQPHCHPIPPPILTVMHLARLQRSSSRCFAHSCSTWSGTAVLPAEQAAPSVSQLATPPAGSQWGNNRDFLWGSRLPPSPTSAPPTTYPTVSNSLTILHTLFTPAATPHSSLTTHTTGLGTNTLDSLDCPPPVPPSP